MSGSDPRRALGAAGERLARTHLEARGLTVLDTNFRTRHGELDIVAADRRCLVFCEVKTRIARGCRSDGRARRPDAHAELGPFAAIGPRKRSKLRLLAREWLARRGADAPWRPELRFDAVGVELDERGRLVRIDHLEGAF
jgi:putative endonuclease